MCRRWCRSRQRSALLNKLPIVVTRKVRRSLDLQRRKREPTKVWNSRSFRPGEGWWDLWQVCYLSNIKHYPRQSFAWIFLSRNKTSTQDGSWLYVSARISFGIIYHKNHAWLQLPHCFNPGSTWPHPEQFRVPKGFRALGLRPKNAELQGSTTENPGL